MLNVYCRFNPDDPLLATISRVLREIEKKYDNARSDPRILPDDSGKVKTIEIKLKSSWLTPWSSERFNENLSKQWGYIKYYYAYNSKIKGKKTMNAKCWDIAPMILFTYKKEMADVKCIL